MIFLYQGLVNFYNLFIVKFGFDVGVFNVLQIVVWLGINCDWLVYLLMLLGVGLFSLMEVVIMYQIIVSGGFNMLLWGICSVFIVDGQLFKCYLFQVEQCFDLGVVYLVQNVM